MAVTIVHTKVRKCGRKKEGGVYLIGAGGSQEGCSAVFTQCNPPIPYPVKLHRGPRVVTAQAVLARKPMDEWWYGTSAETEIAKRGVWWEVKTFGMPANTRCSVGECAGMEQEDAITHLATNLTWDEKRMLAQYRDLTILEVQNMPRAAVLYDELRTAMATCSLSGKVDDLLSVHAAVWRLALSIPPRKRDKVIPVLMRMMVLLNMPKDAIYMRDTLYKGDKDA